MPPPLDIRVAVDWSDITVPITRTAASIEVDVMPFLSRADWGGPFKGYYEALRFVPNTSGEVWGAHSLFRIIARSVPNTYDSRLGFQTRELW